jgi:4-amino-4-deoxy-L-arabinose transferase-like glycosyltransferase
MLRKLWERYSIIADMALLLIIALGLRLWGIGFDLPNLYHPDEYVYVNIALNIIKTGDFNPHFFQYPSLFLYVVAAAYIPYFLLYASRGLVATLDGLFPPLEVLVRDVAFAPMPSQFLVGRAVSVSFAAATVVVAYLIGRRLRNRRVGLFAGLLLCWSPTHVRFSHFITPDAITTFFVALAALLAINIMDRGGRRDYVLAGIAVGLAATTKYNAGLALVLVVVAHWLRAGKTRFWDGRISASIVACGAAFLVGSPYALLDLPGFLNGLAFEIRHYSTYVVIAQPQNTLLWYLAYLWKHEGAVPLMAGVQMVRSVVTRSRKGIYLVSFPLAYLLFVSSYPVRNDRTLGPALPLLCVLAAVLMNDLVEFIVARVPRLQQPAGFTALTCAVLFAIAIVPFKATISLDLAFSQPDVRTAAAAWIEGNLPPGSRIMVESYSPQFTTSVHRLQHVPAHPGDHDLQWYRQNADYVLLWSWGRYAELERDPKGQAIALAQYHSIFGQFALIKEFDGVSLGVSTWVRVYAVQ